MSLIMPPYVRQDPGVVLFLYFSEVKKAIGGVGQNPLYWALVPYSS